MSKLKRNGINKFIALGHSGIEVDIEIARSVPDIDIVIGGHTNTFLYTGWFWKWSYVDDRAHLLLLTCLKAHFHLPNSHFGPSIQTHCSQFMCECAFCDALTSECGLWRMSSHASCEVLK